MKEHYAMMPLGKALSLLCEIHTATDHSAGFTVQTGAIPHSYHLRDDGDYVEAWKSVRYAIGLQVEPADGGMQ